MDRHTQLISVGEGNYGADFNVSGQYYLQALYTGGEAKVLSSKCSLPAKQIKSKNLAKNISLRTVFSYHVKIMIICLIYKLYSVPYAYYQNVMHYSAFLSHSDRIRCLNATFCALFSERRRG